MTLKLKDEIGWTRETLCEFKDKLFFQLELNKEEIARKSFEEEPLSLLCNEYSEQLIVESFKNKFLFERLNKCMRESFKKLDNEVKRDIMMFSRVLYKSFRMREDIEVE